MSAPATYRDQSRDVDALRNLADVLGVMVKHRVPIPPEALSEVAEALRLAAGRFEARLAELATAPPPPAPPSPDGRTHYAGCWRTPGHHDCAIAEIERIATQCDAALRSIVEARALLGVVR